MTTLTLPVRPPPQRELPALSAGHDLEPLAAQWQRALDAADRALRAAAESLPASYLGPRRRALVEERRQSADLLVGVARERGIRPLPWLSSVPIAKRMLGLDDAVEACVFDLDGVLTDSDRLHAEAWAKVLDDLLLRLSEETGWQFVPFDRTADYRTYIDGRSRLDGVHAFLTSRGIHLADNDARRLAQRKGEAVARALASQGVAAVGGARRYLEAAGRAGLGRAVVSASANTLPMLELAGLAPLVDVWAGPAPASPEMLLDACRRLGSVPQSTVAFTHRPAGVAAGHAAGMRVIGVGADRDDELLRGFGADAVVPSLEALLDRALAG